MCRYILRFRELIQRNLVNVNSLFTDNPIAEFFCAFAIRGKDFY